MANQQVPPFVTVVPGCLRYERRSKLTTTPSNLKSADIAIAFAFEVDTSLCRQYSPGRSNAGPLHLSSNTPLLSPLIPFSASAGELGISEATAAILDDIRFLMATVRALPDKPSAKELRKVHSTSSWISERIARVPWDPPESPSNWSPLRRNSSQAVLVAAQLRNRGEDLLPGSASSAEGVRSQSGPALAPQPLARDVSERGDPVPTSSLARRRCTSMSLRAVSPAHPADGAHLVHRCVRLSALLYSRAILERRPFSAVVTTEEFLQLWTAIWRVPLTKWKSLLGIFNWLILPIVPVARGTPHDQFVKSMMTMSIIQLGLENWDIFTGAMDAALGLQRWLRREESDQP
jgi:hypothetical protein